MQRVSRTTLRRRTLPGVVSDVWCLGGVGVAAADLGRRQEPFHTLDVSGWCTSVGVHVTATDPLCTGRHPNLVTRAIISDHRARGVAAMGKIIARERRIVPAGVPNAIVDGVMPVVIVIGVYSVPAAVVRFECVMRPAHTGVRAGYDNALPRESQPPDVRRVRVSNSRLDRLWSLRLRRRLSHRLWLGKVIVN